MIENVTKSVNRKETVDEAYMTKLYEDVTSLYRLDQIQGSSIAAGKTELGALPSTAVLLLGALGGTWILIIIYAFFTAIKKKKSKKTAR
jgi:multiple sugar transport system substrate-binding protein